MRPNPIKLVVSDIDGTLITSNHELTEETRRVANELYDREITLTLASSRPPRSIAPLARALNLTTPYAAFNGATIVTTEGKVVSADGLSPSITSRVKALADEMGLDVWLYDDFDWYAPHRNAFVEREEHTSGFGANLESYVDRLREKLNKLTVVGKPDLVAEAEKEIIKALGREVAASRSKPRFLDITAFDMHKGSAVSRLAALFKIPLEATAVIGDGPNDIEMFKQAGVSIAMGQAVDLVRANALYVTTSNDEEGWARGIEEYVLEDHNQR